MLSHARCVLCTCVLCVPSACFPHTGSHSMCWGSHCSWGCVDTGPGVLFLPPSISSSSRNTVWSWNPEYWGLPSFKGRHSPWLHQQRHSQQTEGGDQACPAHG